MTALSNDPSTVTLLPSKAQVAALLDARLMTVLIRWEGQTYRIHEMIC